MVSKEICLRALKRVLNTDKIQEFHQVLFIPQDTSLTPQILYLCLLKHSLIIVDVIVEKSFTETEKLLYHNENDHDAGQADEFPTIELAYEHVSEVIISAESENLFAIVIGDDGPDVLKPFMQFSSCYRKEVIEALQTYFNTSRAFNTNVLTQLKVRFVGSNGRDPRMSLKHPTYRLFNLLPKKVLDKKMIFYRKGYFFFLPDNVYDQYEMLENRSCSTYIFRDEESGILQRNHVKRIVARFLPEQSVSINDVESEEKFKLWVESIAYAIARKDCQDIEKAETGGINLLEVKGPDEKRKKRITPFVPDEGPYFKKMNIVGDIAQWLCYKVHIIHGHRNIGVMGVRRRFVPPMIDTYQDMLFVLFGKYSKNGLDKKNENFMRDLEEMVDSLSPSSFQLYGSNNEEEKESNNKYEPYFDKTILRARANALFFTRDSYAWMKNHLTINIYPRTKFINLECNDAAWIFCKSIAKLLKTEDFLNQPNEEAKYLVNEEETKDDDALQNPLSILSRMQSERIVETRENDWGESDEDWRKRISRYFAYCVDGGTLPGEVTLRKLAEFKDNLLGDEDSSGNKVVTTYRQKMIDKVIDFILYFIPDPSKSYEKANRSIIDQFEKCIDASEEFRPGFVFNEWVMVKLFKTGYIANLFERDTAGKVIIKNRSINLFSTFLKALLDNYSHNLELVSAITDMLCNYVKKASFERNKLTISDRVKEPLLRMLKIGNIYLKENALRALTALTITGTLDRGISFIDSENPIKLAKVLVTNTERPLLIRSVLSFLKTAYVKLDCAEIIINSDSDFVLSLGDFLVVKDKTNYRFHPNIIGDACVLLLHIIRESESRIIDIVSDPKIVENLLQLMNMPTYSPIMMEITSTFSMIVCRGKKLRDHKSKKLIKDLINSENVETLCAVLKYTKGNNNKLGIWTNVLTALHALLDIGKFHNLDPSEKKLRIDILKVINSDKKISIRTILKQNLETAKEAANNYPKTESGGRKANPASVTVKLIQVFRNELEKFSKSKNQE